MGGDTLTRFLENHAGADPLRGAVARTIAEVARAGRTLSLLARDGAAAAPPAGGRNADGDLQTRLDIAADELFLAAARAAPVAVYASEERPQPEVIDPAGPLALAVDPLDGSANVDLNVSFGSIFTILPSLYAHADGPAATVLQPGSRQLAAGIIVYGPQLSLLLSVGGGTFPFAFSERDGEFRQAGPALRIPPRAAEFAINASNYRHWGESVRLYVDDCVKGEDGPRGRNFNMRWIASLVAECHRILVRGGVFLYPADARRGYAAGRLRLVYEANPVAFLVEQAGGLATDTLQPILALKPDSLHQRVPLVFGSEREVTRIARYHTDPSSIGDRAPLFGNRSLFRV